MNRKIMMMSALCMSAGMASAASLLVNGDFEIAGGEDRLAEGWTQWSFNGWNNRETNGAGLDDSFHLAVGTSGDGSNGAFQEVPGAPGQTYQFSVWSGADAWWLPTGEVRLFFMDDADGELAAHVLTTTDAIHDPDLYDVGVPWQEWSITETAPAGTTKVKVEVANPVGTGTVRFDNASLTAVPEPTAPVLLGLSVALMFGYRRRD